MAPKKDKKKKKSKKSRKSKSDTSGEEASEEKDGEQSEEPRSFMDMFYKKKDKKPDEDEEADGEAAAEEDEDPPEGDDQFEGSAPSATAFSVSPEFSSEVITALNVNDKGEDADVEDEDQDESNAYKIRALYSNVKTALSKAEGCSSGQRPTWSAPQTSCLALMVTEEGLIEQSPVAPPLKCLDKSSASSVLTQFSMLPLEQVHHFAYNGEYLNALFKDRKLVDLLIHIEGRTFYGHRCVLCAHSGYFSSVLVDSSVPPWAITDITIKSLDPNDFKKFLNFAYTGEIFVSLQSVESLRNLASKLKSKTLRAKIAVFLSKAKTLSLDEALHFLLNNVTDEDYMRPVAMETVVKNFKNLLLQPGKLCRFSCEDLTYILQADNLLVDSELDAFWAALYWVAVDPVGRAQDLNKLMASVRFTTMSSLELMDCARVSELVRLSKKCQALLINANWVCHVREVGLEDPLGLNTEQKRSSLLKGKQHEPTVAEFDMRFLVYNALLQDRQGRLLVPAGEGKSGRIREELATIELPSRKNILRKKGVSFSAYKPFRIDEPAQEPGSDAGGAEGEETEGEEGEKGKGKDKKKDKKKDKNKKDKKKKDKKKKKDDDTGDDETENNNQETLETSANNNVTSLAPFSESSANNNTTIGLIEFSNTGTLVTFDEESDDVKRKSSTLTGFSDSSLVKKGSGVDPLMMWEKGTASAEELLRLGGDILQPLKPHTVHLSRSKDTRSQGRDDNSDSSLMTPTSLQVLSQTGSNCDSLKSCEWKNHSRYNSSRDQSTTPAIMPENPQQNFNYDGYQRSSTFTDTTDSAIKQQRTREDVPKAFDKSVNKCSIGEHSQDPPTTQNTPAPKHPRVTRTSSDHSSLSSHRSRTSEQHELTEDAEDKCKHDGHTDTARSWETVSDAIGRSEIMHQQDMNFDRSEGVHQQDLNFDRSEAVHQQDLNFDRSEAVHQQDLTFDRSEVIHQQDLTFDRSEVIHPQDLNVCGQYSSAGDDTSDQISIPFSPSENSYGDNNPLDHTNTNRGVSQTDKHKSNRHAVHHEERRGSGTSKEHEGSGRESLQYQTRKRLSTQTGQHSTTGSSCNKQESTSDSQRVRKHKRERTYISSSEQLQQQRQDNADEYKRDSKDGDLIDF